MVRARTPGLLLAACALLVAGCGSTVAGTAVADGSAASSSAPSSGTSTVPTSTAATSTVPTSTAPTSTDPSAGPAPSYLGVFGSPPASRPAELSLAGVDTCSLVTTALQQQLTVSGPGEAGEQRCRFPIGADLTLGVGVGTGPASRFLDSASVAGYPVDIGGYLAVVGWNLPDVGTACFVNLDVAPEDNLEVVVQGSAAPGTDALCPAALIAAASVLEELKAR